MLRRNSIAALSLLAALAAGIIIGRSWTSPPAAQAGSTPVGAANGDTNGDGARDIADALYLLEWLFLAGPEPAPATCPPRFRDNGDGTVSDSMTGLLWQKGTMDVDGDGAVGPGDRVSPEDSGGLAAALDLGGFRDWRVPNQFELFTLIDLDHYFTRTSHIDPVFDAAGALYWVSSTNGSDPCHGCPMGIDFSDGIVFQKVIEPGTATGYVRAVRGEQWPEW